MADLQKSSKKFPNAPGVYFWLNASRKPIYIGRAGSLKKRIASYFRTKDSRINEMVAEARGLKFQKTDTLLEAIVLEANLIKKYWPKYNVRDKDNRSFVYVVITKSEYPKPIIVRGREIEKYGANKVLAVFGPYQSYGLLKVALGLVRKIFPFSTCVPNSGKACFHYQIGLCPGVCIGAIAPADYKQTVQNFILFFRGEKKRLLAKLKKENPEKIKALQQVADTALLSESSFAIGNSSLAIHGRIEGYDISHLAGREPVGAMVVFEGGQPSPDQYRLFNIKEAEAGDDIGALKEVLQRRLKHTEWPLPNMIFVDGGANQVRAIQGVLAAHNVSLPIVGISKAGQHAASAYDADKLVIANTKKSGRELLIASKKLFQQVRNEAHRFSIRASRRRRRAAVLS